MSSEEDVDDAIQVYFDEEEWEDMSGYEKKHYFNVKRNYEAMIAAGLNPCPPNFMTSKKSMKNLSHEGMKLSEEGLSVRSNAEKIRSPGKKDDSGSQISPKEDNSPNAMVDFGELRSSTDKTSEQLSPEEMRNLSKRYKEIDLMVTQKIKEWKDGEERKLNTDAEIKPAKRSILRKSTSERIKPQKQQKSDIKELEPGKEKKLKMKRCKSSKCEKSSVENTESNATEKPAPGNSRYPKRQVPRINYKEPKDLDEDDFLFCEDCNREYEGSCPVHGSLKFMKNRNVPKDGSVSDRAFCTIPQGLSICPSSIKGAGKGVWADIPLSKGVVFGPYDGLVTDKAQEAQKSGYSWAIYKGGKPQRYVDGEDTSKSNWLRFVNCADCEERQNLIAFQYKGKIFYRTYKPIDIGTEFLVWYGDEYAKELGINTEENESSEVQDVPKPGSESYECERCDVLFSNKDALIRHKMYKHRTKKKQGRHKCQKCTYTSDRKNSVDTHERTHTGEKPYKCTECGRAFSQAQNLRQHFLCHTGERPYSCDICCRSFTRVRDLTRHKSIHLQKKDHMCKFCGKTFLRRQCLLDHERTHTGQRPYKCNQCSQRFSRLPILKEHVVYKNTRNFHYRCPHCNKGFYVPSQLGRHLRVHQLNEE